jgi:hypothetical protein
MANFQGGNKMKLRNVVLALASIAALSIPACGDDDDKSNNNNGGGGGRDPLTGECPNDGDTESSCTDDELKGYSDCAVEKCDSKYKECLGDGYKNGSYGGPCKEFTTCVNKCSCGDDACVEACGAPTRECTSCLTNAGQCIVSMCELPECATGNIDLEDAGISLDYTCDDLQGCCAGLSGDDKTICDQVYNQAKGSGDLACSVAYSSLCEGA